MKVGGPTYNLRSRFSSSSAALTIALQDSFCAAVCMNGFAVFINARILMRCHSLAAD